MYGSYGQQGQQQGQYPGQQPPQQGGPNPYGPGGQQPPQQQGQYHGQQQPQQGGPNPYGQQPPQQQGQYPGQQPYPGQSQQPPTPGQYVPTGGAQKYPGQQTYPGQQQPQQGGPSPYMGQQPQPYPGQQQPYPGQQQQPQQHWSASFGQVNQQEMQQLQAWFNSVDKDRSGSIGAIELAQVPFGGSPLGIELAAKFIQIFDKDRSGSIDFNEYVNLHRFVTQVSNAFYASDRDRSGALDFQEIFAALQQSGFQQLSFPTVNALLRKYDKSNRGQLDYRTFLAAVAQLAIIRSLFEWCDTSRTGRVTLSYENITHFVIDSL